MSEAYPHIAVIGGGAGSKAVLSGLRDYNVELSAIVNMSDNGGSTGILRRELGVMPPGDIRQAISALSTLPQSSIDLFEYRYPSDTPLAGHVFGNLALAAAQLTSGDFANAVATNSHALHTKGSVLPVSLDMHDLVMNTNGVRVFGECEVFAFPLSPKDDHPDLWLEPPASLNPGVSDVIEQADAIVVAPGDLYGSLAPALLVDDLGAALRSTDAPVICVSNLVNKPHQTAGFSPADYVSELERIARARFVDLVIHNDRPISPEFLATYGKEGEEVVGPIPEYAQTDRGYIGADLVNYEIRKPANEGIIQRSYIRHDPAKLAAAIMELAA